MNYFTTKAAAQALADDLSWGDIHCHRYEVHASPKGFYVAIFNMDGHYEGTL